MWIQVGLLVVTLGLYQFYWFYVTLKELHIANRNDSGSGLWVVLLFIPIANWFAGWHYCKELALFTNEKYPRLLMFLLWVFFSPVVWFMSQRELNQASTAPA
ncbi:MAG: DUF4234 domain-containing protein [Chloroflexi bacterium]|nr:DUF4234 domain-containing protein [Chloroflexota bacterium]